MKERLWNDSGAETRFWEGRPQAPGSTAEIHGLYFGSQNRKTNLTKCNQQLYKHEHPKTRTFMSKGYKRETTESKPKHIQNQC